MPLDPSAEKLIHKMARAGWIVDGTIIDKEGGNSSGKIQFSKEASDKLEQFGSLLEELEKGDEALGPIELSVLRALTLDTLAARRKERSGGDSQTQRR